jgi:ATP-dependent Clp endopeptidase proteolytic subunit ClpP
MSKFTQNLKRAKSFNAICRAKKLPEATAKQLGVESIAGENSLRVENMGEETHLYLSGAVGGSFYDEAGITEKEVRGAFKSIPKGKKINVHINSEGGSVQEGLGIYNAIKERAKDVTCYVDGYALSIASVFPLAAGKVVSPKSAIWMIHNAWSFAQGNSKDMMDQAKMLEEHDAMLAEIYSEHTGKSTEEIRTDMAAETWIRGSAAVEYGLADESDDTEEVEASYAALPKAWLDRCSNIPANILNALRVPSAETANREHTKSTAPDASGAIANTPAPITAAADDISPDITSEDQQTAAVEIGGTDNNNNTMPTETITAAAQPSALDVSALRSEVAALKKENITNRVRSYVAAQKISKEEIGIFVDAAMKDESGTFAVLESKSAPDRSEPLPKGGFEFGSVEAPRGWQGKVTEKVANLLNEHKTPQAKFNALQSDYNYLRADALRKDGGVMAANTYSATLTTNFLILGATTKLSPKFAAVKAFARDVSVDPYKPLASGVMKFTTSAQDGSNVLTNATNFAQSTQVVAPVTISVSPSPVTVPLGTSKSFRATVSGAANTSVTWSVIGAGRTDHGSGRLRASLLPPSFASRLLGNARPTRSGGPWKRSRVAGPPQNQRLAAIGIPRPL